MKLVRYKKLVAAVIGLVAVILGPEFLGLVGIDAPAVTELVFALLTAIGVYKVENET